MREVSYAALRMSPVRLGFHRLGVTFHRPMAPQSETTRMIIYESRRLPPHFLKNLLTMAVSIVISLQRTIADKKAKSERSGHKTTAQCGSLSSDAKKLRPVSLIGFETQKCSTSSVRHCKHKEQAPCPGINPSVLRLRRGCWAERCSTPACSCSSVCVTMFAFGACCDTRMQLRSKPCLDARSLQWRSRRCKCFARARLLRRACLELRGHGRCSLHSWTGARGQGMSRPRGPSVMPS